MTIYVKEYKNITINAVAFAIKEHLTLLKFTSLDKLVYDDVIIISVHDDDISDELRKYNIVEYETAINEINLSILKEYSENHDYYYLKDALVDARDESIDTLISGSSYGAFGIEAKLIQGAVNLSSIAQDLYYTIRLLRQACDDNPNIKNVVICSSYYMLFGDISRSNNNSELERISKVYSPILKDYHNSVIVPYKNNYLVQSAIFNVEKLMDLYSWQEYCRGFFNERRPRHMFHVLDWGDNRLWHEIGIYEKKRVARTRTEKHQKLAGHMLSYEENINLFQNFLKYADAKNINVIVVLAPVTKYYNESMSFDYKSIFYKSMNELNEVVHIIDLTDNDIFSDEDFVDPDHLSDAGAIKLTIVTNNVINEMREN